MLRKLVRVVFDNVEPGGAGSAPPADPPAGDTPPADPPPTADPPAGDTSAAGLIAAAKAERQKRQESEAALQAAREETAYYRGLAERTPTPAKPVEPPVDAPPVAPVKPRSADFEDFADFEAAEEDYDTKKESYLIQKAKYELKQEMTVNNQTQQRQATEAQVTKTFLTNLSKEAEVDPDITTIANTFHLPGPNHIPLTGHMQEAIRESDVGPKLLRYFANNKSEATRLAGMSPTTQLREIGRIEASIINKPAPQVRSVSLAPDPINPVGGGDNTPVDEDKIPMTEYLARERAAQTAKRTRR
jgi:hypothetical protein